MAGVSRLELMIDDASIRKLRDLAARHGVPRSVILQRLIASADAKC